MLYATSVCLLYIYHVSPPSVYHVIY